MPRTKSEVYIAMLRGVNVGGKNKLPNAALQAACESAGGRGVRTYLQSGNVVFVADDARSEIARRLKQKIADATQLDVAVLLRTGAEMNALVRRHPFGTAEEYPGNRVAVVFLDGALPEAAKTKLQGLRAPGEQLTIGSQELFAYFPTGLGTSKLANLLHGKTLGVTCTVRNWNTVSALAELANAIRT